MVGVAMLDGRVRDAVVVIVGIGWVASIFGSIFNPNYEPDPSINAAFALVIGAVLGIGRKDSNGNGKNTRGRESDDDTRKGQ